MRSSGYFYSNVSSLKSKPRAMIGPAPRQSPAPVLAQVSLDLSAERPTHVNTLLRKGRLTPGMFYRMDRALFERIPGRILSESGYYFWTRAVGNLADVYSRRVAARAPVDRELATTIAQQLNLLPPEDHEQLGIAHDILDEVFSAPESFAAHFIPEAPDLPQVVFNSNVTAMGSGVVSRWHLGLARYVIGQEEFDTGRAVDFLDQRVGLSVSLYAWYRKLEGSPDAIDRTLVDGILKRLAPRRWADDPVSLMTIETRKLRQMLALEKALGTGAPYLTGYAQRGLPTAQFREFAASGTTEPPPGRLADPHYLGGIFSSFFGRHFFLSEFLKTPSVRRLEKLVGVAARYEEWGAEERAAFQVLYLGLLHYLSEHEGTWIIDHPSPLQRQVEPRRRREPNRRSEPSPRVDMSKRPPKTPPDRGLHAGPINATLPASGRVGTSLGDLLKGVTVAPSTGASARPKPPKPAWVQSLYSTPPPVVATRPVTAMEERKAPPPPPPSPEPVPAPPPPRVRHLLQVSDLMATGRLSSAIEHKAREIAGQAARSYAHVATDQLVLLNIFCSYLNEGGDPARVDPRVVNTLAEEFVRSLGVQGARGLAERHGRSVLALLDWVRTARPPTLAEEQGGTPLLVLDALRAGNERHYALAEGLVKDEMAHRGQTRQKNIDLMMRRLLSLAYYYDTARGREGEIDRAVAAEIMAVWIHDADPERQRGVIDSYLELYGRLCVLEGSHQPEAERSIGEIVVEALRSVSKGTAARVAAPSEGDLGNRPFAGVDLSRLVVRVESVPTVPKPAAKPDLVPEPVSAPEPAPPPGPEPVPELESMSPPSPAAPAPEIAEAPLATSPALAHLLEVGWAEGRCGLLPAERLVDLAVLPVDLPDIADTVLDGVPAERRLGILRLSLNILAAYRVRGGSMTNVDESVLKAVALAFTSHGQSRNPGRLATLTAENIHRILKAYRDRPETATVSPPEGDGTAPQAEAVALQGVPAPAGPIETAVERWIGEVGWRRLPSDPARLAQIRSWMARVIQRAGSDPVTAEEKLRGAFDVMAASGQVPQDDLAVLRRSAPEAMAWLRKEGILEIHTATAPDAVADGHPLRPVDELRSEDDAMSRVYFFSVRLVREEGLADRRLMFPSRRSFMITLLMNLRHAYGLAGGSFAVVDDELAQQVVAEFIGHNGLPIAGKQRLWAVAMLGQILQLERANGGNPAPTTYLESRPYREVILDFASHHRDRETDADPRLLTRIFESYFFMRPFDPQLNPVRLEGIVRALGMEKKLEESRQAPVINIFRELVAFCASHPEFAPQAT